MKRYGYYSIKDEKENARKLQKTFDRMGKKFNVNEFIKKYQDNPDVYSKEIGEEFCRLMKIKTQRDWDKYLKYYHQLVEYIYEIYLDNQSIHLWIDNDNLDEMAEGNFDFKVWERCKGLLFSVESETNLIANNHDAVDVTMRLLCRTSVHSQNVLRVFIDYYSEEFGFRCLETIAIDLEDKAIYIKYFNEEENTDMLEIGDEKFTSKRFTARDFSVKTTKLEDRSIISVQGLLLALQNSVKEYYSYIDAVKTITTVAGAQRKISKMHEPRVNVIEKDTTGRENYIPVSTLAVRKVYEKRPWQGGHHASPIPHDVQGHWRHYQNGKTVWINSYHKACDGNVEPKHDVNIYVLGK